jgi:DNA topoisomerase-1
MRDGSSGNNNQSTNITTAVAAELSSAGLIYVSDNEPGIRRVRRGKGFGYVAPNGKPIRDSGELQRIASLAIPPAYKNVWITTHARGHLQATGRDARGRKQYRYHAQWRVIRDGTKFDRMIAFGKALPILRQRLRKDLSLPGVVRDKVLATVVTLLDNTCIRVGNAEYARTNKSFGLTTLRDRHFKVSNGRGLFYFRGKGGVEHRVELDDRRLTRIVHGCQELPGQQLFQFMDGDSPRAVDSTMVNDYLREVMGTDFTAKDFRTWKATLRAIELLRDIPLPLRQSERAYKACVLDVVRQVAVELRNTPAVCRKAYINPVTFTAWRSGQLHKLLQRKRLTRREDKERAALLFLRKCAKSA